MRMSDPSRKRKRRTGRAVAVCQAGMRMSDPSRKRKRRPCLSVAFASGSDRTSSFRLGKQRVVQLLFALDLAQLQLKCLHPLAIECDLGEVLEAVDFLVVSE